MMKPSVTMSLVEPSPGSSPTPNSGSFDWNTVPEKDRARLRQLVEDGETLQQERMAEFQKYGYEEWVAKRDPDWDRRFPWDRTDDWNEYVGQRQTAEQKAAPAAQ